MLGLLLILIRGTAASPIAQNAQRSDGASSSIQWTPCANASGVPPELAPLLPPELECGSILVPLDHDNAPSPDTFNADNSVRIGMSRLNSLNHNASSSADRKSIMISPGGPGLAAWITLLVQLQAESAGAENVVVSKAIREEYDVIAMDARGTGLSQSLKCDNTLRATRPDITVNTREEWDALAEWNRAYGESCLKMSGGLVKFMDSQSVAKDMELVRQALGEDKLNTISLSYGTIIAAHYIDLYPEKVGRFVLDGLFDHSLDFLHASSGDSAAFEASLTDYFSWCDANDECRSQFAGINNNTSTAGAFDTVVDKLLIKPLPAKGCEGENATCLSTAGLREFITMAQTGLQFKEPLPLFPSSWANLTTALVSAAKGDGTPFATSNNPDGSDASPALNPAAGTAVMCLDWDRIASYEAQQRQRKGFAQTYKHTRGYGNIETSALNCNGWPVETRNPPNRLDAARVKKSAEVLLLQSTFDPSSGVEWALGVKQQLPQSRFVLRDGPGHTSYALFGESSQLADKFLLEGARPEDNTFTTS